MMEVFTALFYQPLFNLLIFLYNIIPGHDLGVAIILLTLIVKVILFPLSWKQTEAQVKMQELQPKLKEIKEQHKDNKEALARAQIQIFKDHNINPLSSCLPLLIQFPFLIALFYVFQNGLKETSFSLLYPFIQNPGMLNETFLGILSLTAKHTIILAALAAGFQFWFMKISLPKKDAAKQKEKKDEEDFASIMNQQMVFFMPLMTGMFTYQFPNGLGLYWVVQTVLSIIQQYWFILLRKKRT
jgi:YidC/Oxa1 family membrane protein insertase